MEYKDYYSILGVPRDADEKSIKQAFRRLAREYHPDVNKTNPDAEDRFKEVNEAYAVLSDAEKRQKYDRFGQQWQQYERAGGRPGDFDWSGWSTPGGSGRRTRTVSPEEFAQMFGGAPGGGAGAGFGGAGGFSSFFEQLFGGGAGMGPGSRFEFDPRTPLNDRARRTEVPVQVTLEEAFHGSSRTLQRADGGRLEVNIPRGVKNGSKIRMSGAGDGSDIYLKVEILQKPGFVRDGDDLRVTVTTDLYSTLLGGEVEVPTLERPVVLKIPAGSEQGKQLRLRGLGMPNLRNPEQRGDLYATLEVKLPTKLTAQERKLFEQLRELQG